MKHRVTGIYIYPIKSLGGISLPSASLCQTGLQFDRRWMLVDTNHQFLTQRESKQLCLFNLSMGLDSFTITYQHHHLSIPLTLETGKQIKVKVWESIVDVIAASAEINDWFSVLLEQPVTLVYMPDSTHRGINPNHVMQDEQVGFADGYPVLIIGEASMQLLQSKVEESISVDRFRPNIVFSSNVPHEEDVWRFFTINTTVFRGIKPCKRCVVTTINQQTAISGAEPLKTLSTYRKVDNHILFGQNVAAPTTGTISLGDEISVIDYLPLPLPV